MSSLRSRNSNSITEHSYPTVRRKEVSFNISSYFVPPVVPFMNSLV